MVMDWKRFEPPLFWDRVRIPKTEGFKHMNENLTEPRPAGQEIRGEWITVQRAEAFGSGMTEPQKFSQTVTRSGTLNVAVDTLPSNPMRGAVKIETPFMPFYLDAESARWLIAEAQAALALIEKFDRHEPPQLAGQDAGAQHGAEE